MYDTQCHVVSQGANKLLNLPIQEIAAGFVFTFDHENEELFVLKKLTANYGWKGSFFFLMYVMTADVFTAKGRKP